MTVSRQPSRPAAEHVPSPWWGVLMLVSAAAAAVAIGFGGFYLWLTAAPRETRVPDVTGINVRAAEEMLARRGLVGQVASRKYHDKLPADTVISATPTAGRTVRQGRVIEMIVSDGPPTVAMPDVREMELTQATETLSRADLRLARIKRRYDDSVAAGWVMEQDPEPGKRVDRRGNVELVVSAGPKPRPLPPEPTGEPPQDLGEAHYAVVQVTLPAGDHPADVRIEVEDSRGVNVVYRATHDAGSSVTQVVTGYGEATARVYVDDNLIEEKRF